MKNLIGVILGVGFVFRLLFLGKRQLWTDELIQALVARDSLVSMWDRLQGGVILAAPLDYLAQKAVLVLLPVSSWALRFHAVIFGTLSLWFFFRIARRLFGEGAALYGTFLFAFFPLHYHYSQEGQPYALFCFLTLVSYDLLLQKVSGKGAGWLSWLALFGILVLILYTSFLGAVVLLAQGVGLVLAARVKQRLPERAGKQGVGEDPADMASPGRMIVATYLLLAAAACALLVPWARFAWSRPSVIAPGEVLDPWIVLRLLKEVGDNSYPATALLLLGTVVGVRALLWHGRRQSLAWLISWTAVMIPAVLLADVWLGHPFAIGHILQATPPLVMISGYGLFYVGERLTILKSQPITLSSAAIVYGAVLVVISVWIAQSHWRREAVDWQGTAIHLQESLKPTDEVAIPAGSSLLEYYFPSLPGFRTGDLDPGPGALASGRANRRFVVCVGGMKPDPCSNFRAEAMQDLAWNRKEFSGITIFMRER